MWIFFALGASVLWGLSYVLFEQVYKKVSVVSSIAIVCFVMFIVLGLWSWLGGYLKADLLALSHSKKLLWLFIGGTITALFADVLIGLSIHGKNATLAGLVEISYPIFIVLFAYFLFKEYVFNTATIIGGVLVFVGVFVIYFFNR